MRPSPIAPTHSPVDGHVVGLHVLAVVKSAARNRGGYGSPSKNVCPDIRPGTGWPCRRVVVLYGGLGAPSALVSGVVVTTYTPTHPGGRCSLRHPHCRIGPWSSGDGWPFAQV